ncbi:hypothetical protein [Acinetobacter junii]|jgi:hypothetical protein|uniref:hypothetical protein n=1 Tax=Acinetobacter junii TaxID=40215 RepID=UPI00125EEF27|nr:hypothetical protein [Acinetobacter junii]
MEQNTIQSNSALHFGKVVFASWTAASLLVVGIAWAVSSCGYQTAHSSQPSIANVTPSYYGVMTLKLTSDTTGEAIVNLDGYHVFTSFDFELVPDYNGALGSDTKAVFITNLAVDRVLLANGGFYNDFTNADDIRNMISVITAHIERNNMVRG